MKGIVEWPGISQGLSWKEGREKQAEKGEEEIKERERGQGGVVL